MFLSWAPSSKGGHFSGGQPGVSAAVLQSITRVAPLQLFLDLARFLLGKPYPKAKESLLHGIDHPIAWLMEGLPVSAKARAMTQDDIKPYRPHEEAQDCSI